MPLPKITPKHILHEQKDNLDSEINQLRNDMEKVRVLAELFFSNQRPQFPYEEIKKIRSRLNKLQNSTSKKKSQAYYLRDLAGRLQQFQDYWDRTLREIERGTYYRTQIQQSLREKLIEFMSHENTVSNKLYTSLENLYHRYLEASKGTKINKKDFISNLMQTYEKIKANNPDKKVKISLVTNSSGARIKFILL